MKRIVISLGWLCALALPAWGGEGESDRIERASFSVERSTPVANDVVFAQLRAEKEGKDPTELANAVNETMEWALARVRAAAEIDAATGSYQTYQRHVKENQRAWFVSQDLTLESSDLEALRQVLGELQARLHLQSMGFRPSDETRREAEDAMVDAALAAFRERADRVSRALGFSSWKIDELSIGPHAPPPPPFRQQRTMAMAAEAAVAPPAMEAGESRVAVTVRGTILLGR